MGDGLLCWPGRQDSPLLQGQKLVYHVPICCAFIYVGVTSVKVGDYLIYFHINLSQFSDLLYSTHIIISRVLETQAATLLSFLILA